MSHAPTLLRFAIAELLPILTHSETATAQKPSFEDLLNPDVWKAGATANAGGYVDADQVDTAKLEPSILFVKDEGVYLMSNGTPMLPDAARPGRSLVLYAEGLGATADYELVREAVGGDDFAERLPISLLRGVIAERPGATHLIIRYGEESLEFDAD